MVTREEFKFFIKDLVCKGEAIGVDFYPRPRCSLWPKIFGPPNKSMFQLENVLVLAELAALLRFLEIDGKMVQLVLILLPYWAEDNGSSPAFILSQDRTLLHSLHDSLMDIKIFCEEHGVVCLECFSHEVRMRSNEYMDFTAWKIKKQTGGDSKAAGLRKEIDENGHYVDSGKEIGGDGGSKELWLDVHASGSPNVSDDETHEDDSSDKEHGGDGGSEHEFSTHSDGFPGSVDEAESEDELSTDSDGEAESEDDLPTDSDGGFHGSVDEMESIDRSVLQNHSK